MRDKPGNDPFLLRFAEDGREADVRMILTYAPELGHNVVELEDGTRIPAVECFAAPTTTLTEVQAEMTDADQSDDHPPAFFGPTITGTRVQEENTDSDRDPDSASSPVASNPDRWVFVGTGGPKTQTVTKIKNDDTDQD